MKASDEIFEKKQNLVHEILRTRREMGMTQKNIEAACGVKQPVIARIDGSAADHDPEGSAPAGQDSEDRRY